MAADRPTPHVHVLGHRGVRVTEDVRDLARGQPGVVKHGGDGLSEGPEGDPVEPDALLERVPRPVPDVKRPHLGGWWSRGQGSWGHRLSAMGGSRSKRSRAPSNFEWLVWINRQPKELWHRH